MSADVRKTDSLPEWKEEEVEAVVEIVNEYESIGVVDITGIPSKQLQDMRRGLHGSAQLRVARNTLLERALERADADLGELTEFLSGHVGLIGTNDNPFGLYQELEASKTPAPISAGEVTPNDIVVPEGDTGVDPGPFVGELQNVGANARIEDGSIQVLEDSTVLEAGEEVSADLESVLSELGIEPKEVGLDLRAVVADGVLFSPEDLEIDVDAYRDDVTAGAARARNLAINASFPTAGTVPAQLQSARGEAKSLALQANIENPEVVPDLLSKGDAQVRALVTQVEDPDALPEELAEVAEESPAEQQPDDEPEADEAEDAADEADDADESEAEADDADADDDDGDAGDALGEMF